jgi:hypothetical protein
LDSLALTCAEGDSHTFLSTFDEEYETADGIKGGDLKMGFFISRNMPHVVKFDGRPQLDSDRLIEKGLAKTFLICNKPWIGRIQLWT